MKRAVPIGVLLWMATAACGCVDFGHPIAPFRAADDAGEPADSRPVDVVSSASLEASLPPCVEETAEASDIGPQIRFSAFAIDRPALEIDVGDVVTWTNTDTMDHTATAGAPNAEQPRERGGFGSPLLGPGDRWAFRFCAPRELLWFCRTHPAQMRDYRLTVR